MGWVVNATFRPLYHREIPGTLCIGGWVGHRAGLDGCGKAGPHRDSIPRPPSPWRVAILTEVYRPFSLTLKVKESRNRPRVAQRVPGSLGSQISWHSAHKGGEVVSLRHRPPLPPGNVSGTHFHWGWVDPRAMVRSEGICHWKIQWNHRESISGPSD